MDANAGDGYDFYNTATGFFKRAIVPEPKIEGMGSATIPWEATGLNLPENSDSSKQQEILDALPVLIFLEQAGKIVFANTEARQMLGITEGEWVTRPVEDVLVGTVSRNGGTPDVVDRNEEGQPVPRHHAGKRRQAAAGGRHL